MNQSSNRVKKPSSVVSASTGFAAPIPANSGPQMNIN